MFRNLLFFNFLILAAFNFGRGDLGIDRRNFSLDVSDSVKLGFMSTASVGLGQV
jgi:hypothetical protein